MFGMPRLDWGQYKKGIRLEEGMLTTRGFDFSIFFLVERGVCIGLKIRVVDRALIQQIFMLEPSQEPGTGPF